MSRSSPSCTTTVIWRVGFRQADRRIRRGSSVRQGGDHSSGAESSHAIRAAIDEALKCKETGEEKTIVFGLTGTGYFDMVAYEKFNNGR